MADARARAHTQRCLLAASRLGSLPSLPFLSLTAMFPPQTSFFSVRYAGAKANLLRARMRSIPTAALLLRVPLVAANARLSGQHASIRFLTMGKAVSIGLLGIVRVYIPHPLSSLSALVHHSGCRCHAWTKNSGCECHYGMIITNHRHTPRFRSNGFAKIY